MVFHFIHCDVRQNIAINHNVVEILLEAQLQTCLLLALGLGI
jgi:hypothetical protein